MSDRLPEDRAGSAPIPSLAGAEQPFRIPPPHPQQGPPSRVRLGKFLLQRKLGTGGMGVVYQAMDEALRRTVALKTMRPEDLNDEKARLRFLSEARSAAKLRHPGIITIYELGEEENVPYFSMEFIAGEDLATLSRRGIPPRRAVELMARVADAIAFAHAQGVIHRDLKPANIMVRTSGVPVVMDFGLAKEVDSSQTRDALTAVGQAVGTPAYMPPEQILGDKASIGPPTDVYSLGVILFELLSGRRPFDAQTPPLLMLSVLKDPTPRLVTAAMGLPADLEFVIDRCLQKRREDRFPDAEAMLRTLKHVMAGNPIRQHGRLLTLESGPQRAMPVPPPGNPADPVPGRRAPSAEERRASWRRTRLSAWCRRHTIALAIVLAVLLLVTAYALSRRSGGKTVSTARIRRLALLLDAESTLPSIALHA